MHGKISPVDHDGTGVFKDIPSPFNATRYHSLIIEKETLPDCLQVNATSQNGEIIMGVKHKQYNIHGVQFHPESIACEHGHKLIENFLSLVA